MFNEEGVIGPTLSRLVSTRYHHRYRIIVVDDASLDGSLDEARANSEAYENIVLLANSSNGQKVGALKLALRHVHTPYVLLIDADSMVTETFPGALDDLVSEMRGSRKLAVGLRIRPPAVRLVEKLQRFEYIIFPTASATCSV
jgi:glycosyltransferase involved in cell wall biosynthesis